MNKKIIIAITLSLFAVVLSSGLSQSAFALNDASASNTIVQGKNSVLVLKTVPLTTSTIAHIQFKFPAGFTLTGAKVFRVQNIGAGYFTFPNANTLQYDITTPTLIPAGQKISLLVGNIVYPSTPTSSTIVFTAFDSSNNVLESGTTGISIISPSAGTTGNQGATGTTGNVGIQTTPQIAPAVSTAMGFRGNYAPSTWFFSTTSDGSVYKAGAPAFIALAGGNDGSGSPGNTDYTVPIACDGAVTFNWYFHGEPVDVDTGPQWDPSGYTVNGVFTQVTDDAGTEFQNGFASVPVSKGDTFGFHIHSLDNAVAPGVFTSLTNFSGPCNFSLDDIRYVQSAGGDTDYVIKNKPGIIFYTVTSTYPDPQKIKVEFIFTNDANTAKDITPDVTIQPGKNTLNIDPLYRDAPFGNTYGIAMQLNPDGVTDEADNYKYKSYDVKQAQPIKVLFRPVDQVNNALAIVPSCNAVTKIGESSKVLIEAMYPLAPTQFETYYNCAPFEAYVPFETDFSVLTRLAKSAHEAGYTIGVGITSPLFFPFDKGGEAFINIQSALISNDIFDKTFPVAHEIGHDFGLIPPGNLECKAGHSWDQTHTCFTIKDVSFDSSSNNPLNCSFFLCYWDFMVGDQQKNEWISQPVYDLLFSKLKVPGDPTLIDMSGQIFKNGTVILDPWYKFDGTPTLTFSNTGNFTVEFVDENKNVLASSGFDLSFSHHIDSFQPNDPNSLGAFQENLDHAPFEFTIPYVNGAHLIVIKDINGKIIAQRIISPNPPTVHVITPNGGEHFFVGQKISLKWDATDPDKPVQPLSYAVDISYDNGTNWLPITIDYTKKKLDFTIPPTDDTNLAVLRVMATDGINTSQDVSDSTFSVSNVTPLQEKTSVISSLNALTPTNRDDKKDLSNTVKQVTQSTDPTLWNIDGIHLNAKKGDQVFEYEKNAVVKLAGILKGNKEIAGFNSIVQNDITSLVDADKGITTAAIYDATSGTPKGDSAKDLAAVQKALSMAADDSSKGHYDKAIEDYENAWKQAQKTLKDEM